MNGVAAASIPHKRRQTAAEVFLLASKTVPEISNRGKCFPCELLLADSSPEQRAEFEATVHDYDFEHGSVLYRATTSVDAVYFVQKGAVKLVQIAPDGDQRIIRVLRIGDVAGIESIFSLDYEHTAFALGDVSVCSIPVTCFRKFAGESGRTQMWLLKKSLLALKEAETWISQLVCSSTPARTRIARLMLRLRVDDGDFIHRMPNKEMGAVIGLTPETVCRIISDFCRQGIVAKDDSGSVFSQRYFRGNIPALDKIAAKH